MLSLSMLSFFFCFNGNTCIVIIEEDGAPSPPEGAESPKHPGPSKSIPQREAVGDLGAMEVINYGQQPESEIEAATVPSGEESEKEAEESPTEEPQVDEVVKVETASLEEEIDEKEEKEPVTEEAQEKEPEQEEAAAPPASPVKSVSYVFGFCDVDTTHLHRKL